VDFIWGTLRGRLYMDQL